MTENMDRREFLRKSGKAAAIGAMAAFGLVSPGVQRLANAMAEGIPANGGVQPDAFHDCPEGLDGQCTSYHCGSDPHIKFGCTIRDFTCSNSFACGGGEGSLYNCVASGSEPHHDCQKPVFNCTPPAAYHSC